ncbi:MAG: chemotaxis protein CheC [Methanomicrobiales archaeon]|jgi:chemotaxis protein CheC|nr:chemotaxis protein CheC [Methanomicrobiales archaeon]
MEIDNQQLDMLKEMGNIGASHAATSLSQMLMSEIDMTVPQVAVIDISQINQYFDEEICAMVVFEIQGEIEPAGYIVCHIPQLSAIRLTNTMLGSIDEDREFSELDKSAIIEIGNIMISHFLDATAELLGVVMLPSPPMMSIDMALAAFENILAQVAVDINEIILFSTELKSIHNNIQSTIIMLPQEDTLKEILRLLNNLIDPVI